MIQICCFIGQKCDGCTSVADEQLFLALFRSVHGFELTRLKVGTALDVVCHC